MRLDRLDLTRYGRFTDAQPDFPAPAPGAPDLHVIFGPNEAGKSTLFSAWLDLLYGVPLRTRYDFLHPGPTMQIGAKLTHAGGVLEALRLKRNGLSLQDANGQGDAGFDVLIACAFNYDAHSSEFDKLGRIRALKARMNPDPYMARDLKSTGAGNLFVIFGEPDIRIAEAGANSDGKPMVTVQVFGVDVFKPQTGEVQSEGTEGIALWMLDTDYNEESFFVRHAYFLGANDPYKALKTTLRAEIDEEAWESLYSDTSRPFAKPKSGRIAVKVINHLGDEVMKVFAVE